MQEMKTEHYVEIFDLLEKEYGEKAPSPGQVKFLWRDSFLITVQWKDRGGSVQTVKCVKESDSWCLRRL